jgi:DNA modification methylase
VSLQIINADVRAGLAQLEDRSVNCVVTSPPYWGLRDYGVAGQIGSEPTFQEHISLLVGVFREVRRVLKDDGTLWLNYGDCYAGGGNGGGGSFAKDNLHFADKNSAHRTAAMRYPRGLKAKDLCMLPARLAIALCDDGWWLRSEIIWHKPNPMPESTRDRPTSAHEKLFLLAKSPRYYYDADAVRTPAKAPTMKKPDGWDTGAGGHGNHHRQGREKGERIDKQRGHTRRHAGFNDRWDAMTRAEQQSKGANLRNVWTIAPYPFKEAHFATFPPALVEPCIKAGCPVGGVVLDPFFGAGTTGLVAMRLGRACIGIELNPDYVRIAEKRLLDALLE